MISSFKCRETEAIWQGRMSQKLPHSIQDLTLRKLRQLDAALTIDDLRNPPSNHLESLKGNRKGQMSIRFNDQWRLCFIWHHGEVIGVAIVDYH